MRVLRGGRGVLLRRGRAPGGRGTAPGTVLRRAARQRHPDQGRRLPGQSRDPGQGGGAGHDGTVPVAAAQARRGRGDHRHPGPRRGRRARRPSCPRRGGRPADRRRPAARPPAPAPRARLHQVASHHVPAARAQRHGGHAHTRSAHPRVPDGDELGPAQLVPAAARTRRRPVGRRGARRMPGRPAGHRGDQAGRAEPARARPVRVRRLQGLARAAEPVSDRRP